MKKILICVLCLVSFQAIAQLIGIDENLLTQYYRDADGDSFGNKLVSQWFTSPQGGWVLNHKDCDDTNPSITTSQVWYRDIDGDGFGVASNTLIACSQPTGYVSNSNDACPSEYGTNNGCPVIMTSYFFGDKNYIYEEILQVSAKEGSEYNSVSSHQKLRSITFFDGLGKKVQSRAIGVSPLGKDIVSHVEYDNLGRATKGYLPYASTQSNGYFETGGQAKTLAYYNTSKYDYTTNPYSEVLFDESPLSRVLETSAPGNDWKLNPLSDTDHTNKMEHEINTSSDHIRKFNVYFPMGNTETPNLQDNGFYTAGSLYKFIVKDENWTPSQGKDKTTETFKNKQGQVLLKRTYNNLKAHDTYYVYDDFGNLTYVLSPEVNTYTNTEAWANDTFNYELDDGSPVSEIENIFDTANDFEESFINISFSSGSNTMNVDFEASFGSYAPLNAQVEISLPFGPELPNMYIGEIEGNDYYNGWSTIGEMYIEDNMLIIESDMIARQSGATSFELSANINLNYLLNNQTYTSPVSQDDIDKLGYQYKYDKYNRLVERKLPSKGREYIVYDKLNRPILTQDAVQRAKSTKEWLFTKYDAYGRIAYTGVYKHNGTREYIQNEAQNYSSTHVLRGTPFVQFYDYTNSAYPVKITLNDIYTVNYYDDYNFDKAGLNIPTTSYSIATTTNVNSLQTGSKERVMDVNNNPTGNWITTIIGYDDKGRVIYTANKNDYLDTSEVIEMKLDFIGKIEETNMHHTSNTSISITNKFDYDHVGRLLTQKQIINTEPEELIVKNNYDELGRLKSKKVGNTELNPLQTIDFEFNIRGWLRRINDPTNIGTDLFSMELHYNDFGTKQYNGNISAAKWKTANDSDVRRYQYYYDDLNRITNAYYYANGQNSRYNIGSVLYDKNGNIQRLYRKGAIVANPIETNTSHFGNMDYLKYSYNGNQLMKVDDLWNDNYGFQDGTNIGDDYSYNENGNLIKDENKGITSIEYNHLDLPTKVHFGGTKRIEYIYTVTGRKLEKKVINTNITITQYAGAFIYENNVLKNFSQPEGYVEVDGGSFTYVYQYMDHLGNIRLNYVNNGTRTIPSLQVRDENNYYPFGSLHKGYNNVIIGNQDNFKYNNKELQGEVINGKNLQWYDYGARNYDPSIGRFFNIDPLADSPMQVDKSPYAYVWNNPIKLTDPTGMHPEMEEENWFPSDPDPEPEPEIELDEVVVKGKSGKGLTRVGVQSLVDPPSLSFPEDKVYSDDELVAALIQWSNPHHISKGIDSHLIPISTRDAGLGTVTTVRIVMPKDFGAWDRVGSDGRQWIGCMSCHGNNGAYRTLAYNNIATTWGYIGAAALDFATIPLFNSKPPLLDITTQNASKANVIVNRGKASDFYRRLNQNWDGSYPRIGYESFKAPNGTRVWIYGPRVSNQNQATIKIVDQKNYKLILRFIEGL